MKNKPMICLDFDGVLHEYTSKFTNSCKVLDRATPGAIDALELYMREYTVCIFSSRSKHLGGIPAMRDWLIRQIQDERSMTAGEARDFVRDIQWPMNKPPALFFLDDNAYRFTGTFPSIAEIKALRPWNHDLKVK